MGGRAAPHLQRDNVHPVAWGATDDASGVARYDVQVSIEDGEWTAWLTDTLDTEATYVLGEGGWFTFRVTATDNVSNAGSAESTSSLARVTKYYYHGGRRVAMQAEGVVYYLHGDHLGSTSLTTCGSETGCGGMGAEVAWQWYYPYGETRWTDGTLPTDFGFTGQRHDSTGLIFMRARYYPAALGRFISADTVVPEAGNPQSLNRFSYVLGNPLRYTDPSGHMHWPGGGGEPWWALAEYRAGPEHLWSPDLVAHAQEHVHETTALDCVIMGGMFFGSAAVPSVIGAVAGGVEAAGWKAIVWTANNPVKAYIARAVGEELFEAWGTGTPPDPMMVAMDLASAGILDDLLPRRRTSTFSETTTPWGRTVYQRGDIDWDLVRPDGMTNVDAAIEGYAPGRIGAGGAWEVVQLHHLNQNPDGSFAELWTSTHQYVPHKLQPSPSWRVLYPDKAEAYSRERPAYWRWRAK